MRTLVMLGGLVLALVVDTPPSHAYEGPWCARFWGGDDYFESCSMRSFEMCLAEIRGTGGNTICSPNPNYRATLVEPGPRRKGPRR
jgi:hypothetical protein